MIPRGSVAIVVLARDPRNAKTRLRPALAPKDRAALALAMLDDVVTAAVRSGSPVLVVTDASSIASRVRRMGAHATISPARGTRAGAAHGLRRVARDGAAAALVIAADLPYASTADIRRVLRAGRRSEIVIVSDERGTGTNALFLRPPSRMAPRFGRGSLAAHRRAAGSGGPVLHIGRLGTDIDTPADLRSLQRSRAGAGPHTRRALSAIAGDAAPSTRRGSPSPRVARSRTRRAPQR